MITYMFPGQGSQIKGMGENIFSKFPELTQKADSILGYSIEDICLHDRQKELNQTQFTQPALYVVNALSYRHKIQQTGKKPDFVVGHSLGEYNALEASGGISFEDGLKLVQRRGLLMSQAPLGSMAAVLGATGEEVEQLLKKSGFDAIDVANFNSPAQIVISGLRDDILNASQIFQEAGKQYIILNTSGAFHSRYMESSKVQFEKFLQGFSFSKLQIPVISNVTARPYVQSEIAANLAKQITHSIKWTESIRYLLTQGNFEFEEMGVGNVLTKLITYIKAQEKPLEIKKMSDNWTVQEKVDLWNSTHPIGAKVSVIGYKSQLETRTEAIILFGHRAAIYMKGYNGYFALDEVTPA
ncbi:ACP S-malonyltransferase [Anabaena sp. UHCC 0451]|uniref:ACP S-malonyltransferase n=1 Tax=Anabaena sp. UHCC 0451 TaxID=2055235 RepID=UPI000CA2A054|nr:ACP S-malonyltransferase [Anabaena sp. UHCC 0451]ATX68119.1 malonyl CoA-acyl carrier protein transacylase [Anabaena sp. UHCC 0451]MEA5576044.1 ACP S-malonyltransferase [Anabaena sp. UHCC 0451]